MPHLVSQVNLHVSPKEQICMFMPVVNFLPSWNKCVILFLDCNVLTACHSTCICHVLSMPHLVSQVNLHDCVSKSAD